MNTCSLHVNRQILDPRPFYPTHEKYIKHTGEFLMDPSDTGGSQHVEPTAGSPRMSKARHGHVGGGPSHMLPQKQQYRHPMQQQVR